MPWPLIIGAGVDLAAMSALSLALDYAVDAANGIFLTPEIAAAVDKFDLDIRHWRSPYTSPAAEALAFHLFLMRNSRNGGFGHPEAVDLYARLRKLMSPDSVMYSEILRLHRAGIVL